MKTPATPFNIDSCLQAVCVFTIYEDILVVYHKLYLASFLTPDTFSSKTVKTLSPDLTEINDMLICAHFIQTENHHSFWLYTIL